jgi:hypothetical protein
MRQAWPAITACAVILVISHSAYAQQNPSTLVPAPKTVTMAQLKDIDKMNGQLVHVTAVVRHTDTAQIFTFGEKAGVEIHAVIPNPAIDTANVGDTVALTGFVRHFSPEGVRTRLSVV